MHTISTDGEIIDYQRDPSSHTEANLQLMYNKLQSYNEVNQTKKALLKKSKKLYCKNSFQNQKHNEAQNISNILKKVRKNNIIQEFVNKLKMNITLRNLKAEDQNQYFSIGKTSFQEDFRRKIRQYKIHKVMQSQTFDSISIIVKFFVIFGIFYINSLKLAFEQLNFLEQVLKGLIVISICFFAIQYGGMAYTIHKNGIAFWKNFVYWAERDHFIWSLIMNFGLLLELTDLHFVAHFIIILVTLEMIIHMKKFKKVENLFVLSINFQRYWELTKIVLFNFFIAHILSILLNLMGSIAVQDENNWYVLKNIRQDDQWTIKYVWGYYWGTNIMLSVGFGDISAQNHVEALLLIFIETISCMIMAYNISEVSKILQSISEMDQQRKFKFKVFNQMSQKYDFPDQFKANIISHIDKSIEKKNQLNYIEENLIEQLPQKIKLQVKREVNKNVFLSAYFFRNLTKKTQNLLAQKVNKIFAHPQEIILKNLQTWKIYILRQGSVAITFKKGLSVNNGTIIQQFSVDEITKPELLSLKFIRKIPIKGDLKSLDFSILNMLEIENFEKILKEHDSPMFEFYCSERDKTQYHQFDLQIRKCQICSNLKHDKFQCPRMHFVPLREHVIHKRKIFYRGQKVQRNQVSLQRKRFKQSALKVYYESGKDDDYFNRSLKPFTDMIVSSFQAIGLTPNENNPDMGKKLDKCLQKLDESLKIMKGIVDAQQLEVDLAWNYKRYFPQQNPDNLMFYLREPLKRSRKKITSQKKLHFGIL